MTQKECRTIFDKLLKQSGIETHVTLDFNTRLSRVLARAFVYENKIEFGTRSLASFEESAIVEIIKHELAHIRERELYGKSTGHSPRFKQVCQTMWNNANIGTATLKSHKSVCSQMYSFIKNNKAPFQSNEFIINDEIYNVTFDKELNVLLMDKNDDVLFATDDCRYFIDVIKHRYKVI